eukprot:GHVU01193403.1.p1 GENE.GHVU01193403.1~~GHVU01193403.1.p1  ORF type:complete len:363 (+),score=41.87 GHVU01193403.1:136-1089(+)
MRYASTLEELRIKDSHEYQKELPGDFRELRKADMFGEGATNTINLKADGRRRHKQMAAETRGRTGRTSCAFPDHEIRLKRERLRNVVQRCAVMETGCLAVKDIFTAQWLGKGLPEAHLRGVRLMADTVGADRPVLSQYAAAAPPRTDFATAKPGSGEAPVCLTELGSGPLRPTDEVLGKSSMGRNANSAEPDTRHKDGRTCEVCTRGGKGAVGVLSCGHAFCQTCNDRGRLDMKLTVAPGHWVCLFCKSVSPPEMVQRAACGSASKSPNAEAAVHKLDSSSPPSSFRVAECLSCSAPSEKKLQFINSDEKYPLCRKW